MMEWLQLRAQEECRVVAEGRCLLKTLFLPERSGTATLSLIHDLLTLCRMSHPGSCLEVAHSYLVVRSLTWAEARLGAALRLCCLGRPTRDPVTVKHLPGDGENVSQLPGGDWDRILEDAIVSSYETMLASVWWRMQLLPSVRAARI